MQPQLNAFGRRTGNVQVRPKRRRHELDRPGLQKERSPYALPAEVVVRAPRRQIELRQAAKRELHPLGPQELVRPIPDRGESEAHAVLRENIEVEVKYGLVFRSGQVSAADLVLLV